MKTVQKLEFSTGIATLIAAFIGFYKLVLPGLTDQNLGLNAGEVLSRIFLFLFLPSILTAMGAYIHAVKQFTFGLVFLYIGGGFLALFHGFLLITGVALYTSDRLNIILTLLPGFLAAITIFFALRSRKSVVVSN
jgi:ATP/ADP translocase